MADSQSDRNDNDGEADSILGAPISSSQVIGWLAITIGVISIFVAASYYFPPRDVPEQKQEIANVKTTLPKPEPRAQATETKPETKEPESGEDVEDTQFSVDLGASAAMPVLMRRYRNIARSNSHLISNLKARAYYTVSDQGPVVRLRIGPLDTNQQARDLCDFLQLPQLVSCSAKEFLGDPVELP